MSKKKSYKEVYEALTMEQIEESMKEFFISNPSNPSVTKYSDTHYLKEFEEAMRREVQKYIK